MKRAGLELEGGGFHPGFRCYGVFIGSDEYVRSMLKREGERLCSEIDKMMHLLRDDCQAAWVILSTAMAHQLDYSLTLQYPTDVLECAKMVDARIWAALEQLAGQPTIARGEEGGRAACVLDLARVPSLQGRSYQRLLAAQPVKLGGLGIRSLWRPAHLPSSAAWSRLCPSWWLASTVNSPLHPACKR